MRPKTVADEPIDARRLAEQMTAENSIGTIRCLVMDAVELANSGHPGAPLALAPAAYVLWSRFLRHNPADPSWPDRDRFVLSCGHASMLLYAMLHLTGYDLSLEELRRFRQWGSRTPGHPERDPIVGVETTTGPLGQGVGNAVGMAIAERFLAHHFNRPGYEIVNHRTWALVSDGDLMEGVASEAASIAGHLRLQKLTLVYDDNRITIEGDTALTFSEDVALRFQAYGWHVQRVADGNDLDAIQAALEGAVAETARPSLVILRTHIADPAPNKRGDASAHGAPLGADEVRLTKELLGWPADTPFHVPSAAAGHLRGALEVGAAVEAEWRRQLSEYGREHPELAAEFQRCLSGELPAGWDERLPEFKTDDGPMATRSASGKALNALAVRVPNLVGGSADLAPSNKTLLDGEGDFGPESNGRNFRWGVREHGMGACLNGMAAHGGLRVYGATFLIFTDYMRPSIRLAAMMELPVTYVCTHDSIGLGEDGPTHQPIEQLSTLRAIPNLTVIRPADATETVEAWRVAMERQDGPVLLALTRQKLPVLDRAQLAPADGLRRGAYVLVDRPEAEPRAILIATGSEVHLALAASERLAELGIPTRVVSMPSWELFEAQSREYRDSVLPPSVRARVAVEAGCRFEWLRYITDDGEIVSIDRFGASAPGSVVFEELGFTVERVAETVMGVVNGGRE